jgi:hypothetical protein
MSAQRRPDPEEPQGLVEHQQAELEHLHTVAPSAPMTRGQWHGFWVGTLVGGGIGLVLGAVVGLVPFADLAIGWRVLITAVAGAVAGGTAGAVYFGGRVPEIEGEMTDADGKPAIGSSPRDPSTDSTGHRR